MFFFPPLSAHNSGRHYENAATVGGCLNTQ